MGRRHESPDDWIDFRKAGTIVVSERNWIASGCSPDKKRIVSIRWTERRRENGNRRGRRGCLAFAKKKEKGRDSISSNEILFPVDAFDSIPFFRPSPLPFDRFLLRFDSSRKKNSERDESDWIVGKLVSFLRGLLDIFFFRSRFSGTMGGKN